MSGPNATTPAAAPNVKRLSVAAFATPAAGNAQAYCPPTPLVASEHLRNATEPNAVVLNVYDVMGGNSFLWTIGWGMHHVGVQIYGKEYHYGYCEEGKGIGRVLPRQSPQHIFRESVCIGQTELSATQVEEVAETLMMQDCWLGSRYHIVSHNCIDFAHAFCSLLLPPAVRVAQAQQAELVGLENGRMEEVVVAGVRYMVPVLIPPYVDRLARHAARLLPRFALERLEAADLPLSSVSGSFQHQP
ncbi:hypothetical protein ABL78_5286 [Leptomonas seymouri]|uniref:PPPDE domain-containing protein n=1 Tax=Leptomonas seymouri TaxID=5684 RepID=A0A0N1HVE7_LEPSE|nr:hypothetical protein ABL78_5286 [Leptomonas seymouri]|eukprot:KPI85665.1 hypothetical protein ABL78_5286 [Leptomonas seymouri]